MLHVKKTVPYVIIITLLFLSLSGAVLSADPNTVTVNPSTQIIKVYDKTVKIPGYNINGNNFFKLRGIAQAVDFGVVYEDGVIKINKGFSYIPDGSESIVTPQGKVTAQKSSAKVTIDGNAAAFDVYNINGSNYFKLRDIASAVDFGVSFDSDTNTIYIDPQSGYWAGDRLPGEEIFSYNVGKLDGIGFVPYEAGQSAEDGTLMLSDEQIERRLAQIAPYTNEIRTFGCAGGLEKIPKIAVEKFNLKVATGLYICNDSASNDKQIQNALACAPYTSLFICGNESINLGFASEQNLIKAINDLRAVLKKAGYGSIPVVTNETLSNYTDALLNVCDGLMFSYYPYINGASAADAGKLWFPQQLNKAVEKAKGKTVYVGESGWPSYAKSGESKEKARREAAIYDKWAIYEARQKNVKFYLFVSHDEDWKMKYGAVETTFGILDKNGNLKYPELFRSPPPPPPTTTETTQSPSETQTTDTTTTSTTEPTTPPPPPPGIQLTVTQWPSPDNDFHLKGTVTRLDDPSNYRISAWIKVDGVFWAKPTWDDFLQFIGLDGSFDIRTYSHVNDYNQNGWGVLLVKESDKDKLDNHDYAATKKYAVKFIEK